MLKSEITGGFWKFYKDLNRNSIVKNVYDRFKDTGRFDALKCDWHEGMPNKPHIFWDSDVMKWIEGASYIIEESPEPALEKLIDEMVDNITKNQRADGYFNSYFLTIEPDAIYQRRADHELYCTGHAIEAAIAYHRATGKDKLLSCVLKNVDLIYKVFMTENSAAFVTPGHEEIELALLKLYDYTGNEKHLNLARFFIDQRGNNQKDDLIAYNQSDVPVREITEAKGHAVRACYLYTAMAMLADADKDEALKKACQRIFDDITHCKLSITGGIGTDHKYENFSYKYDIPNSDTYNETCAGIALCMFAQAMQKEDHDSRYGDLIERILYNGFLSGVSLDGRKFFYANPLEIDCKKYARSTYQPWCERIEVFDCSCCPPNVVRTLGKIQDYIYTLEDDCIYCDLFAESKFEFSLNGKSCTLTQTTDYPMESKITFSYKGEPVTLLVRIPDWCTEYTGNCENGYAKFHLADNDSITIDIPMEIHFFEADPRLQDNSGRYCLQRGPFIYCMEGKDNGENLRDITLMENSPVTIAKEDGIPAPVIYMQAERRCLFEKLYAPKSSSRIPFTARLIPYFAFANREIDDMILWVMVK